MTSFLKLCHYKNFHNILSNTIWNTFWKEKILPDKIIECIQYFGILNLFAISSIES